MLALPLAAILVIPQQQQKVVRFLGDHDIAEKGSAVARGEPLLCQSKWAPSQAHSIPIRHRRSLLTVVSFSPAPSLPPSLSLSIPLLSLSLFLS